MTSIAGYAPCSRPTAGLTSEMGIYDFSQRELRIHALEALAAVLFKVPRLQKAFSARTKRIRQGMIQPYQKVLEA